MKLCVFVSLFIGACVARPDMSQLMNRPSNAYLPSRSGSVDDGDDSFINVNIAVGESQVSNVPPSTVLVTEEPTRATQSPQTFGVNRQSTSNVDIIDSNQPTGMTHTPEIQTTGLTPVVNIEPSSQPTRETPNPNIVANTHQSSSSTEPTTLKINVDEVNQPVITTQIPQTESETDLPTTTFQSVPAPQPDATLITETRFNQPESNIQSIPTGSYLPTSDLINNIFQGPQSSFGDGSFLPVPGLESVQNIGAEEPYKSVYFFAAPEEETQTRLRINILPSAQASTRVIFIKAPTYTPPIPEIISAPSPTNPKTVIYVLSKKPDPVLPISVPTTTFIKPAKPQIFFIKYGSQKEAKQAIASGIDEQVVGENIQALLNEQSFLNAIMDSSFVPDGSSGVKGSGTAGAITPSKDLTPSKAIVAGSGTVSVTTVKPSKGSKFGPAGESGPY